MEIVIILLIILLLLAVGGAVLVMSGVIGPATVMSLTSRRPVRPERVVRDARVIDLAPDVAPARELTPDTARQLDALSDEVRRSLATGDERLASINHLLGEVRDDLPAQLNTLRTQAASQWDALLARQAAVEARQSADGDRFQAELARFRAEQERFWAELSRHVAVAANPAAARLTADRASVAVELYALLAKLETAVAAVTNPMLLPGEPYAPPAELPAEALVWENWKEVGECSFAFAERFSSRRVVLSLTATDELAAYIVELRGLLTSAIYPNLRPLASPAQSQALRQALQTLAVQFQRARAILETELLVSSGQSRQLPPDGGAA